MRHTNIHPSNSARPKRRTNTVAIEPMECRRLLTSVVVNTTIDAVFPAGSPFISLRNAIATANATPSTTITFDPKVFATAETITLNGNQLELSGSVTTTITAPAAGLTLNGNNASRVLQIDGGTTVNMTGITIAGGSTTGGGGGIVNSGTLTMTNCTVTKNATTAGQGGIENDGNITLTNVSITNNSSTAGVGGMDTANGTTATLTNVTISGNHAAGSCGGIYDAGTLTMKDCTVSGNSSGSGGGGIEDSTTYFFNQSINLTVINSTIADNNGGTGSGGIANYNDMGSNVTLTNVTISDNTGTTGGGYYTNGGTTTISNTIIAGNTFVTGGSAPDVSGSVNSLGYNLIGKTDGSLGFLTGVDLAGTIAHPLDAKLGSLANNGGPTETLLPLAGSPAIGAGLVAYVPSGVTTDQRGLPRIVNGKVDIGAVEVQGTVVTTTITVTPPAAQTATVGAAKSFSLGSFSETNATGPYTATVVWGDGTANTTIKLTAAGTIPATTHTYTKAGTDSVSVTLTDSASHTSNKATFAVTVSTAATTSLVVTAPVAQTATAGTAKSFALGSFTETNSTGPYSVDVSWGDGSSDTKFTQTSAGTITAQSHTFAKVGTDTVSITITDAKGHKSNTAAFKATVTAAATGTISGIVFNDSNGDKKQDDGELGLGDCTVFIDLKNTGKYAAGDPTAVTPFNGSFAFTGLAAGTYKLLVEPEPGTTLTTPTVLTITLKAGGVSSGNLFGLKAIA